MSEINLEAYNQSPGTGNEFQDFLLNRGRELGYTELDDYSMSIENVYNLCKNYFANIGLDISAYYSKITNDIGFYKAAINSDNPVILQIYKDSTNNFILNHAVIGFGYDADGMYANSGWGTYRTIMCISNYVIPCATFMSFEDEHVCSNNYVWKVNNTTGTICSCGKLACVHGEFSYVKYDESSHKYGCADCNEYIIRPHNFYESNGYKICYDCGYKLHLNHNFTYTPMLGKRSHWANCSCGVSKRESCVGIASLIGTKLICAKCEQTVEYGGALKNKVEYLPIMK